MEWSFSVSGLAADLVFRFQSNYNMRGPAALCPWKAKVMSQSLRFGVCYDFRNPPDSGIPTRRLFAEALDQIAWLDGLGLDLVWFSEHHFVNDGYLPSWIPVASAAAMRTGRVRFSCDVCLLPFNHPVRLAEDLAVLDNLSRGRVDVGIGMGSGTERIRLRWMRARRSRWIRWWWFRARRRSSGVAAASRRSRFRRAFFEMFVVGRGVFRR